MQINSYQSIGGNDLSEKDLLSYLAQVVLSKTEEKTERATEELTQSKDQLMEAKDQLKSVKHRLTVLMGEYERIRVMHEALRKIDALRKEGVVIGVNKSKIAKILTNIEDQSLQALRSLEDKLSAYVPETPKISYG